MESDIGNPIEYNPTIIDKDPPEQAPATDLAPEYYYPVSYTHLTLPTICSV